MSNLDLTISESSDLSFDAVDFVGIPFAPTVEVEDIEGGHRVSITSMGADGKKTDVFDVMDGTDGDPLNGNALIGELAEGTVLTTDDAYSAPPQEVDLYGVSTQVTTTGKNLLSDVEGDWQKLTIPNVATRWVYFIPATENASYTYSRNAAGMVGFFLGWADDTSFTNYEAAVTLTNYPQYTVTNTTHAYLVVSISSSNTTAIANTIKTRECQIEQASAKTDYEPYSGKIASPRPSWPQQIKSVDDLEIVLAGKNMIDQSVNSTYYNISRQLFGTNDGKLLTFLNSLPVGTYALSMKYTVDSLPVDASANREFGFRIRGASNFDSITTKVPTVGETISVGRSISITASNAGKFTDFYLYSSNATSGSTYATMHDIQIEIGTTATAYAPYIGQSVTIPLSNNVARSLPDGTRDTLTLSYIGPSETAGYGVFGVELVQRVSTITFDGTTREMNYTSTQNLSYAAAPIPADATSYPSSGLKPILCDRFTNAVAADCCYFASNTIVIRCGTLFAPTSRTEVNEWLQEHPTTFYYQLASEVTHDLGTIELPVLPAPDLTAWADGGSAQPTMQLEYERALSIVIPRIEAQLADLATS